MALTNLNKEVSTRLFEMLALNDDENKVNIIKQNYSTYSKLSILAEQIMQLQLKARQIISDCEINSKLQNMDTNIKKVPGTFYYLYMINDREVLSIIAPEEWTTYQTFYGKFYYDYDHNFYQV